MARSNIGGTRSFIRGKVANDIYQVAYNVEGKKQQFIKSVASHVTNPNTKYQALARMQMALLMSTMGQFRQIIDHSWEGITYGSMSIAYYVKKNMPLLQEDCRDRWDDVPNFVWEDKGSRRFRKGCFIMSEGSLELPSCLSVTDSGYSNYIGTMHIATGKAHATFGDLKAALGINAGDYITFLEQLDYPSTANGNWLVFHRLYLADGIDPATVITNANVDQMFTHEGNEPYTISYNQTTGVIDLTIVAMNLHFQCDFGYYTIIVSKWTGTIWARNNSQFAFMPSRVGMMAQDDCPSWHFQSWWPDYDGESYAELFPDKV